MRAQEIGFAALLMAATAVCGDHSGHVRRQNTSISARQLPSPCNNPNFRKPVYSLDNVNISKRYEYNYYEDEKAVIQLNFTLRDTANNYSLRCVWGPLGRLQSSVPDWLGGCVPEDADVVAPDEFQTRTSMLVKTFAYHPTAPPEPIEIAQLWMCGQENGSYPLVYQASAPPGFRLNVSCPEAPDNGTIYTCNVTTPLPVTIEADWKPPTLPSGSAQLVPQPDPPYVSQGLTPPPDRDCNDMSLSHPDWTVEGATYIKDTSSLNLTITSRATNVQAVCQSNSTGNVVTLSCSPTSKNDPFGSRPKFTVEYTSESKSLRVQHDWVCGDPKGTYKTEYRAAKTATLPLTCGSGNNACRLEKPLTIQGELLRPLKLTPTFFPPPPNTNVSGCTARSATPRWEIVKFYFKETTSITYRFKAKLKPSVGRTLEIEFRNAANNFTESCSLRATVDDGATPNNWWSHCRTTQGRDTRGYINGEPGEGQRDIETRVNFKMPDGVLTVNQTWYCDDADVAKPALFQATGFLKTTNCGVYNETLRGNGCSPSIPLEQCRQEASSRWCAFNAWDPANPKDTTPNPPATITGTLIRTEALPAHALTDPDPQLGDLSCTANSAGRPVVWRLLQNRGPFLSTGWPSARDLTYVTTKVSVSLENSALRQAFPLNGVGDWDSRMTPYLPNFTPTTRYGYIEQAGYYKGVVDWGVRFDPTTGYLELSHSWECLDKHPGWRTVFTGTWKGFLKMNCTFPVRSPNAAKYNTVGLVCSLADGDVTLMPKTSIEFGKAGNPDGE